MFKSVDMNSKINANESELQDFINNATGDETKKIGGVKKGMILKEDSERRVKKVTMYLTQDEHDFLKRMAKSYKMTMAEYTRFKTLVDETPIKI